MKKLFFVICLMSAAVSFAKKWDAVYINKLIAKGDIDKVIQHYQDEYFSENRNPQDAFKIAELYVKKKDYASAMQWYDKEKQLINTSKVNLFNYANTNRLMGEYQKALDGYLMYAANTGDVMKVMDFANQCEKILKLSSQAANYKLDNFTYNTADDELNIALLRTNAIYCTVKKIDNKEQSKSYTFNQAVRNFEDFTEPVIAYKNNIPKLIITSLSYTKDGNTVVFSAKEEKPTSKKNSKDNEKIYIADNLGGNFLNPKLLSFNTEGYSYKNPSFNDDGTAIYFSSNQTGSIGGFDIWQTNLENGKWKTPVNLGSLLNTKTDEIYPFIAQSGNENTLYFSSERDGGFGGFDIYSAKKSFNIWQDVEMLSAPVNSAADDISIVYDNEVKTGYFTSNRKEGKGGFDVYRFTPFNLRIIINALDSATNKPIDYAYAQLIENGIKAFEGVTDEKGKASFQVGKNRSFKISVSKDNYKTVILTANSMGKANGDSVVIDLPMKQDAQFSVLNASSNAVSMGNYIIYTGHVIDGTTNKSAIGSKMRMVNYTTQKVRELDLDKDGKFEIKLLLNNNYKIIFENQSNKIIDELTTYGLEKNDVKVRDYVLSGSKFKLTENKVYKSGNLPNYIKIENSDAVVKTISNITYNEPITQSKIDSLMKIIENGNPQTQKNNKPTSVIKTIPASTPNFIKSQEPVVPAKKDTVTIVVGKPDVNPVKMSASVLKPEKETNQLAADIIITNKNKKIKIIKSKEAEPIVENPVIESPTENTETVVKEAPKQIPAEIITPTPTVPANTVPSADLNKEKTEKFIESVKENVQPLVEVVKEAPKENIIIETPKTVEKTVEIKTPDLNIKEKKITEATISSSKATIKEQVNASIEELPDLYYKIQLASYEENNLQFPEFDNFGKVEMVKAYDRYIYRLGNFIDLERAKQILDQIRAQGYFVAFILQYNKEKVTAIIK